MSKRKRHRVQADVTVGAACQLLETVLDGGVRADILDALQSGGDVEQAVTRLRGAMRSHVFPTSGTSIALGRVVNALDVKTRGEGFHVLQSWDYHAQHFADQIVPVLLLDRCGADAARSDQRAGPRAGPRAGALSVLLDQYFLSVLGLLAVRAWDDEDPDAILDRVTDLIRLLHGAVGGGSRFVDDAETLLLLAVSHYHPRESAYDSLLDRVRALNDTHRLHLALACAPVLGSHLRWGLDFMYKRDLGALRDDNVVDYPWLLFSLVTLRRAHARGENSASCVVEGLVSGLSADPWAFFGKRPRCLPARGDEHAELYDYLHDRRDDLLAEAQTCRPEPERYSPLGFAFNFLCNAVVAMAATAVTDAAPHPSLNALLTTPRDAGSDAPSLCRYAKTLMTYARGRGIPGTVPALIVYDPWAAQHAFNTTVRVLQRSEC